MDQLLLKFQCGFRQWYNAQHFLLAMLEKQKFTVDKKKLSGDFLRISQRCSTVLQTN